MDLKSGFKVCPFCKEQIRDAALKCRYCGEWLEGSKAPGSEAQPPVHPSSPISRAVMEDSSASNGVDASKECDRPTREAAEGSRADYWYGYVYVLFCAYLTYCCVTHLLGAAMTPAPEGDLAKQTEYWASLPFLAAATAFFAHVTYKLARREATRGMIYIIVTLHGLNVLARGIRPGELVIWIVLSWVAVNIPRERIAQQSRGATEDEIYELLNKATQLETKGRVHEAIKAYRELAETYPDRPAGEDARKSLESLEAKVTKSPLSL